MKAVYKNHQILPISGMHQCCSLSVYLPSSSWYGTDDRELKTKVSYVTKFRMLLTDSSSPRLKLN
ncbi:hypothetical protein HanXRQr2_Chr17g0801901 [Helianthus annuus]|uniref:Uncharacterized protein n=1 Tax=Helianthus annuus TaxID=4232 RepID=A0A9K3DIN2_HELAN|nr:hypothetical protein HanXRQr2_Chr17g0801901 [Helianthus annuus]KAJ0813089.1 hypothetical protein HanPSC8_Chr17g0769491 [Helianthus annuus]